LNKSLIVFISLILLCFSCVKKERYEAKSIATNTELDFYNSIVLNDSISYLIGGDDYAKNSLIELNKNNFQIQKKIIPLVFDKAFKNAAITNKGKIFIGGISGVIVHKQLADTIWNVFQTPSYEGITGMSAKDNLLFCSTRSTGGTIELRNSDLVLLSKKEITHDLQDIVWLNSAEALAVGTGAIMRSTDSGYTWQYTEAKGDIFNSIAIVSSQLIYVSGLGGSLRKSEDGGITWKKVLGTSTSRIIQKIMYSDKTKQLLMVGNDGLCCVLNTNNDEIFSIKKFTNSDLFGGEIINQNTIIAFGAKGELWQVTK
jgi:hypothetical protein